LQVYGYNELYWTAIREKLGALVVNLSQPAIKEFLKRFLLLQGYLHSDYSPSIEARLLPRKGTALTGKLALTVKQNPLTTVTMDRLVKKLKSLKGLLRAFTLSPLLKMGTPGRGFHTGGSFPMSGTPREFQADILGRPMGLDRVHLVDSSVFPSIPANTITLTAMANAHRIAANAAAL
jgi:choline dehydrogenase-like flavoprotein